MVVTGASSGVGAACAKAFHSIGCKLILCGRNTQTLQEVADSLSATDEFSAIHRYPPKVVRLDLADLASIPATAAAIVRAFDGRVDILVNNAGMSYRGEIESTKLSVDERLFTVNYLGQVALTKALLPQLLEEKDDGCQSHVVAVSSVQGMGLMEGMVLLVWICNRKHITSETNWFLCMESIHAYSEPSPYSGKISIPFRSAYSSSKHALQSFFDCLRSETANTRLSVHVLR